MAASYIETLSIKYPNVKAHAPDDGNEYEFLIHDGGDPIPPQVELDTARLVLTQEKMWRDIQLERDRRKSNGVKVGANWFHSDDTSRIQQLGLVMFGANMPAGIMWKTLGGGFVLMTPTLAMQIFMSVAASDQAIFAKAEYHKSQMLLQADPSNYNYLSGWPLTFGE